MSSGATATDSTFLDELVLLAREDRNEAAIALLELNAMRADGDITDAEFAARKADLLD